MEQIYNLSDWHAVIHLKEPCSEWSPGPVCRVLYETRSHSPWVSAVASASRMEPERSATVDEDTHARLKEAMTERNSGAQNQNNSQMYPGRGTTDWFQIGKGVSQGCILSPCLFNLYAEYIMKNAGLDEAQAGIKIAGRNINNLRYADNTTLWQKVKRN